MAGNTPRGRVRPPRRAPSSSTPSAARKSRRAAPAGPPSVLMIASEAAPFSKTGGLADVLGALPQALGRLGWQVTVAVPRYRGVTAGVEVDRFPVTVGAYTADVGIFDAAIGDGATARLIDCPELYDRDGLYGVGSDDYPDNPRRFAVLVRAAFEASLRMGPIPTVVHAHDWQAGLAPVYLKTLYANHQALTRVPTVFTIHNLAYQGLFEPDWLPRLDLPWALFSVDQLEYWGRISFLKAGILGARTITTVSPTYAIEVQTPSLGFGFDGVLRDRAADLVGILNGIDTTQWDPAHDAALVSSFDAASLDGKAACKQALLAEYGLPTDETTLRRPLIGMISRMVDQKGLDLIAALEGDLPGLDASFVILGTGEARYQDMWRRLAAAYPDRIGARIGFDEALAHRIEAGADIFLMPSRFEPCGLNQMYSLRYGTVPIVRAVGGLADTVTDCSVRGRRAARGNGFVFTEYSPDALRATLDRALKTFGDRKRWRMLQATGMAEDHSWDRSAAEYVKIYGRSAGRARR